MTREHIEGYTAPIHQAVWTRILTMGAPRLWSAVWLVGCGGTAAVPPQYRVGTAAGRRSSPSRFLERGRSTGF